MGDVKIARALLTLYERADDYGEMPAATGTAAEMSRRLERAVASTEQPWGGWTRNLLECARTRAWHEGRWISGTKCSCALARCL